MRRDEIYLRMLVTLFERTYYPGPEVQEHIIE
jgi:hypothetical protein